MQTNMNPEVAQSNEFNEQRKQIDLQQSLKYLIVLLLYFIYTILPTFLIQTLYRAQPDNEFIFRHVDAHIMAIEEASFDVHAFLVIEKSTLELDPLYQKLFYQVYEAGDFAVYTHKTGAFYELEILEGTFTYDAQTDILTIDEIVLTAIINGEKTEWANHAEITFYIPEDSIAPFIQGTSIDIEAHYSEPGPLIQENFSHLFSFILYLVLTTPMIFLMKPSFKVDYLLQKEINVSQVFGKTALGVLYIFVGNFIAISIQQIFNFIFQIPSQISANQLSINRTLQSPYLILTFFMAVLLAPIVEELTFRKTFFGLIPNQKIALLVSSLSFGLIHVTTEILSGDILLAISSGLTYITGGLVLGLIYMHHPKNIYMNIFIHGAYNLVVLSIQLYLLS